MSDHYGVFGLLDVHESHNAADAHAQEARRRRMAVSRLRDVACAKEQSIVQELERESMQGDKEKQMAREEGRLIDAREALAKAAKQRYQARLALREAVFGQGALDSGVVLKTC